MAASSSSFIPTPLAHTDNLGEGRPYRFFFIINSVRTFGNYFFSFEIAKFIQMCKTPEHQLMVTSIFMMLVVLKTAVGERVWNGGAALVGLMYFGECCLTPEWTAEGRKGPWLFSQAGSAEMFWTGGNGILSERATTGRKKK
ncbi:hypothetical protein TNCV_2415111 [Trichonephila clavipes]|nr:hypothetical protein TNCV_2415111 [Trichonephila clavipes]